MPIAPIVGAQFRPPAKALLAALPQGTPLRLQAEPDNEYDSLAVAVWLDSEAIPASCHEELKLHLAGYGFDLEQVLTQPSWHLGFIPANTNKKQGHYGAAIREAMPKDTGLEPVQAMFDFMMDGSPGVRL